MKLLKLRKIIIAVLVEVLLAPRMAAASTCPVSIKNLENNVVEIEAGGGAKFKVEENIIKLMLPLAFDENQFEYAYLNGGTAKIDGMIKTDNG